MLEIINSSNHAQKCKILIKEGHKVSWKRSGRHSKVMKRCVGVRAKSPDKQDRALGTKSAKKSQFPTQRALTAWNMRNYQGLFQVCLLFYHSTKWPSHSTLQAKNGEKSRRLQYFPLSVKQCFSFFWQPEWLSATVIASFYGELNIYTWPILIQSLWEM